MQSYQAARGLFNFVGFIAWIAVLGGGLTSLLGGSAAFNSARSGNEIMAFVLGGAPGAILASVGFFIMVHIQTSRAAVDSAEYGQQAFKIARDQLEVSKQLLKLTESREGKVGYAGATSEVDLTPVSYDTEAVQSGSAISFDGAGAVAISAATEEQPALSAHITYEDGRFLVEDKRIWSRSDAESYVKKELLALES